MNQLLMVIGCLRLSDVSVICRVVNLHRMSQKIWRGFLYGMCRLHRYGNDFELIPTPKMETNKTIGLHPVEGYLGSESRRSVLNEEA